MVPPAAAQRETGPWERKTDKTHSVRGAASAARPLPGRPRPHSLRPVGKRHPSEGGRGIFREEAAAPANPGGDKSDPSSLPRTHRTQIRTHRPVCRGRTPRPPPPPPAAMTPYLARSDGPGACDSSGSLRPHLHLTPRTRRAPGARRACPRGRGAPPRVGEGRGEAAPRAPASRHPAQRQPRGQSSQ